MKERRKYIRVAAHSPFSFTRERKVPGTGQVLDLSLRGLRFASEVALEKGEKIQARFELSKAIRLDLAAVVRHGHRWKAGAFIYGIEFFIRGFQDLKEHIRLNEYILEARSNQDRIVHAQISKEKK